MSARSTQVLRAASGTARFTTRIDGTLRSLVAVQSELARGFSQAGRVVTVERVPPDVSSAATATVAQLDPMAAFRAGLLDRVKGLAGPAVEQTLPRRLALELVFTDPLSPDLIAMDSRYLLPGAERLANNRVAVLSVDDAFVACFLAGANHELARELVWRELPTSPSMTFFHRFWDTGEGGPDDIGPISGWTARRPAGNVTGVGAKGLSVVMIRGDLMRRYPLTHVYVVPGVWDGATVVPDDTRPQEPVLLGRLDATTRFYGVPVAEEVLRGDRRGRDRSPEAAGYFVAIEQPAEGPAFGLDAPADDGSDLSTRPAGWSALSWGHLVPSKGSLDSITHADSRTAPPRQPLAANRSGLAWGHNAAHMAAITWEKPFRALIHADRLLPRHA